MSEANKTQVGGSHYKVGDLPEHWDLARMYQWDPMQYQITKYVMRWKTKHPDIAKKLQDLEKARHFLDKYIEDYKAWLPSVPDRFTPADPNKLGAEVLSNEHWSCEGYYGDGTNLYKCRRCRAELRQPLIPPPHSCENPT